MDASLARPLPTPTIAQSSLPPGWEVAHDDVTGLPYYFNFEKNVSSWLPPQSGGSAPIAVARPQAATTTASRREAAVRGAQERKKEREAQRADWTAREEALKKLRAKARPRVDDGEDAAAVSNTGEGASSSPPAPSPAQRPAPAVRPASTATAAHPTVPMSERRSWLASQHKSPAVIRGAASVADYVACLSKEMDRPVEPVGSFFFNETDALANLQYRTRKEALAAASAGAGEWQAVARGGAPQNLSEQELPIWYAFVAADVDSSGSVSKKELYRAFDQIGLRGTAKERATLYEYADGDRSGQIEWPEFLKLGRKFCQLKALPAEGKPGRLSKAEVVRQRQERSATAIQAAHRGKVARGKVGASRAAQAEATARRNLEAEQVRRRALAVYSSGQGSAVGPAGFASRASRQGGVPHSGAYPTSGDYPTRGPHMAADGVSYRMGTFANGATGSSRPMPPGGALARPDAAARRSSAATLIQTSARGTVARRQVKQRAAATERETKYREAAAGGAASRQILALATSLIENGTDAGGGSGGAGGGRKAGARGISIAPPQSKPKAPAAKAPSAKPAKEAPSALGDAMAKAGVGTKKKPKAAAGAKGGLSPAEQALANKVAFHRAMLATAFAAECKPGSERVPMRALGRILRRAQVPEAETVPAVGEELGHVGITFEEVAVAASKLRARHATSGGLLASDNNGGGVVARAPEAGQLTVESRVALARAFAAADDEARGSVPTSRLPQALASAGVFASPHALRLLLGAELSVRKHVEWRDFMHLATTLVALQREGFQMLEQRGAGGGGELLLTIHEIQLGEAPPHPSAYLQATVQVDAGEELMEPACSEQLALRGARTAVGLQLVISPCRAIELSLIGQPSRKTRSISDPTPVQMLGAHLSSDQLAREYEAVVRSDAPTQLVLPLVDGATERGALILSFAHGTTDPSAALAALPDSMARTVPHSGHGAYCAAAAPHAGASAWEPPSHRARAPNLPTAPHDAAPAGLSQFEARLWRAFVAADTDGSGRLSKRELSRAFAVVGLRGKRGDELAVFKQVRRTTSAAGLYLLAPGLVPAEEIWMLMRLGTVELTLDRLALDRLALDRLALDRLYSSGAQT
jgi:Ca2+-binding EF-hand superfamily protein